MLLYVWPGVTTGSDGTKKHARTNARIAKRRQNEGELCLELCLYSQYWLRYGHWKLRGLDVLTSKNTRYKKPKSASATDVKIGRRLFSATTRPITEVKIGPMVAEKNKRRPIWGWLIRPKPTVCWLEDGKSQLQGCRRHKRQEELQARQCNSSEGG